MRREGLVSANICVFDEGWKFSDGKDFELECFAPTALFIRGVAVNHSSGPLRGPCSGLDSSDR